MAKIRRIIRKLKPPAAAAFDDQMWPVNVSLIVLGGFLIGVVLAYLDFGDPRLLHNAWTWLFAIPLVIGGMMVALRYVGNHVVRRTMQFALVVSLMIHIIFIVALLNIIIFTRYWPEFADATDLDKRRPHVVPEYAPRQVQEREQQDFEEPVPTETPEPEPEPEPVERQEVEHEVTPPEQQPTPVPEPEETVRPSVVRKQQSEETAPRHNLQQSKLSRQMNRSRPTPQNVPVRASMPQTAAANASRSTAQPQTAAVTRRQTESETTRRNTEAEPTTTTEHSDVRIARRTSETSPTATTSATPTLDRQIARPITVPRTQIAAADAPAVSKQTDQQQVRPNTTVASKQVTTSVERTPTNVEPTPTTPTDVSATTQRRDLRTEANPTLAQTPASVPNQRTRTTTRPDVVAVASSTLPNNTPTPPQQDRSQPQATSNPVRRVETRTEVQRRTAEAEPTPTVDRSVAVAQRRTSNQTPVVTSSPTETTTPRRNTPSVNVASSTTAQVSRPAEVANNTSSQQLQARATETARQATANAANQRDSTPDVTATAANTPPSPTTTRTPTRQPTAEANPAIAQATTTAPARQATPTAQPQTATQAATQPTTPSPTASQVAAAPAANAGTVQRTTTDTAATRSQPTAEPTVNTSPQVAAATPRRQTADAPTTEPTPTAMAASTPRTQTMPSTAVAAAATPAQAAPSPTSSATPSPQPTAASVAATRQSTTAPAATATAANSPAAPQPTPTTASSPSPTIARRETADSPAVAAAASAATATPTRQSTTPTIAPASTAQVSPTAVATANSAGAAAQQPTAQTTSTSRQSTGGAAVARSGSTATPSTPNAATTAVNAGTPSRQPRGETAPNIAQANTTAPQRRQSPESTPSVRTSAAQVAANLAATSSTQDQPRPSSATVARQSSTNNTATQSQRQLNAPAASSSTEIARATLERTRSSDAPSISPQAAPSATPARTTQRSAIAASPVNVESPAVAQTTRGVGSPSLEAARTALNRSTVGTAGIGRSDNMDRAKPAADTPAMVASTAARRDRATQDTPAGPALSPSAPALVRRSQAGAQAPSSTLQAEPLAQLATTSGSQEPSQLAANASAALQRSDADAADGPVTAAKGAGEVDLGPTQIVSEGQAGRASGGGQPAVNLETDAPKLARSENFGGTLTPAIAATTVVDVPTSPSTDGGGQPTNPETNMEATAIARADAGSVEPISGGPSKADQSGPPTEVSMAEQVAAASVSRTELAEALPGDPTSGGGEPDDEEDEEERKRRLARQAANAAIAMTPTTVDLPAVAEAGTAGDPSQPAGGAAAPAATAIAKATTEAGAGGPTANPQIAAEATAADSDVTAAAIGRAGSSAESPAAPALAASGGAPQRASSNATAVAAATPVFAVVAAASGPTGQTSASPTAAVGAVAKAESGGATGGPAAAQTADAAATSGQQVAAAATRREMAAANGPATATAPAAGQLARSDTSTPGPPATAAAATAVADAGQPASTAGESGAPTPTAGAVAVARATPAGASPALSGPSAGAPSESTSTTPTSVASMTRASRDGTPGQDAAGGGQPEPADDAPAAAQVARRAGSGAAPPALSGPSPTAVAAAPPSPATAGGGAAGAPQVGPQATVVAAASSTAQGGGPVSGDFAPTAQTGPAAGSLGGQLLAAAEFQRAEAVEGAAGAPQIGGGTSAPTRAAAGPSFSANLQAETVSIAGQPTSAGVPSGSLVAAQGIEPQRLAGGAVAPADSGPVGARAGQTTVDVATTGEPGEIAGLRQASPSSADGPAIDELANAGAPLSRAATTSLPSGTTQVVTIEIPNMGTDNALAQATMEHVMGDMTDDMDMSRQATEGGLAVNADAIEGPGGLGTEYSVDVGLSSRRALRESVQVQMRTARFVRREVGGLPNVSTAAVVSSDSFRRRMNRDTGDGTGGGNGSAPPQTEEAVELGLAFLARYQMPDGSWSLQGINNEPVALVSDTAATALALLAFQGAGYNHREHKYKDIVLNGVNYLVKNQREDGDLFVRLDDDSNESVWLYSHALAALALCEAYGMTQDPELKKPAQKALDFIVNAQHPDRGGWRYAPQFGSDTSVTGWMMMALKSGELANLDVPKETYGKIRRWLDRAQASEREPHLYRYNPYAPNTETQRHGRDTSKTMTSVGLLMRLYLGWRRDNPNMERGAQYLVENPPMLGSARNPERDTYYWYYATQVMFHMGGQYWQQWNSYLHPLLVESQIKRGELAGSWDPRSPIPDRWAPHAGRLYVTTMNLLSLEVYYRHLPLYEETGR